MDKKTKIILKAVVIFLSIIFAISFFIIWLLIVFNANMYPSKIVTIAFNEYGEASWEIPFFIITIPVVFLGMAFLFIDSLKKYVRPFKLRRGR